MLEHIKILSYVILLIGIVWLILYINNTYKLFPYKFLKSIRTYNILVLILMALRFSFFYVKENLLLYVEPGLSPIYLNVLTFSISIVTLLLVYLMLNILLNFNDKSFTKSQNIKAFIAGIIITSIYIFTSFFPEKTNFSFSWLDNIINNVFIFNIIVNNLEFIIIISFYFFWSNRIEDKDSKRISKSFALFYILCNSLSLLALVFIMQINMPQLLRWSIQLFILFLFILTPFLWIKFVFIKYAQTMSRLMNSNVSSLYTKYNISAREQEIIQFLINGKGNNEIKEELFISYHTVKNHLSNIYRKLNVKNRHELVHLFMKSRDI
ncbi:MAG: helix-turn-helix transcriptional regulator [Bacteroidetes bacterium]|nr:helix-turn-helix transcriptional regulator [Bacteroidota bacterium]